MALNVAIIFLFLIVAVNGDVCTWDNCPAYTNDGKINVHLIPHTHDDMGWIKTADDYFTGANADLEHHGVQYIIDTMVEALKRNKDRKMTYAEVGYLTRWIETRSSAEVSDLISLVQNGQLEFSGGGWVQPDEGASHYIDIIDQYTLGLRKLNATFGTTCGHPKIGWQLDPFGHSREHGNILAMLGYEALYVARIHHLEQDVRLKEKRLEFNWYPSTENPNRKLFTGSLINLYFDPPSLCFDVLDCADPIVQANPKFDNYNVDDVVNRLKTYVEGYRIGTMPHKHVFVPMGSDFHYQAAEASFRNMDNLIKVIRNKTDYNIFYSTPACYTKAVSEAGVAWTNKTAPDFFPYASGPHSYWTGYFTSKPACKGLIRQSSNIMNAMRTFNAFALPSARNEHNTPEEKLERACGLAQHHDAVPGTCKEHVTQNYNYRLLQGWTAAESVFQESIQAISQKIKSNTQAFPAQTYCRYLNESSCDFSQNNKNGFSILIVNGYSQPVSQLIRIPLYEAMVALIDENNEEVNSAWILPTFINGKQLPNNNISPYDLQFIADLPAAGFKTYFIEGLSKDQAHRAVKLHQEEAKLQGSPKASTLTNGIITINFDDNNQIASITNSKSGQTYPFKQSLLAYKGHDNVGEASGAYIFRPQVNTPDVINGQPSLSLTYLEARQVYSDWLAQTIRLVPNKTFIEFEWTVGPLPKTNENLHDYGKEVIARYEAPSIQSGKEFYTDSNGRQMILRVRDYNQDFQVDNSGEPVAANMYPVNSRAMIKDASTAFSVLTDRSQAGGSIVDSTLDFLLHRRDFYDDGWGVNEALNEPGSDGRGLVVRGRHRIFFSDPQSASTLHRQAAFEIFHSPIISFSNYDNVPSYSSKYVTTFSGLTTALPQNVHLLTLKQLDASTLLLRLEHIFAKDEDSALSQPATVDLTTLFKQFKVTAAQELTLGGNMVVSGSASTTVTLNPQDIKTYQVTVTPQ